MREFFADAPECDKAVVGREDIRAMWAGGAAEGFRSGARGAAWDVALQARRWLPGREVVLLGDGSSAALDLLAALARRGLTCVTRLRLDAALYEPAPPRRPGTVGRPRTKGARLPNLSAVLADAGTRWAEIAVPGWYGEGERVVEVCSSTAAAIVDCVCWICPTMPETSPKTSATAVAGSSERPAQTGASLASTSSSVLPGQLDPGMNRWPSTPRRKFDLTFLARFGSLTR